MTVRVHRFYFYCNMYTHRYIIFEFRFCSCFVAIEWGGLYYFDCYFYWSISVFDLSITLILIPTTMVATAANGRTTIWCRLFNLYTNLLLSSAMINTDRYRYCCWRTVLLLRRLLPPSPTTALVATVIYHWYYYYVFTLRMITTYARFKYI